MAQDSLHGQLRYDVEYQASAEKVFDFWSRKQGHIPKLPGHSIHNIELLEGTWEDEGGILKWSYIIDGNILSNRAVTEKLDREKKFYSYKIIDGALIGAYYKSFTIAGHVTPKNAGSCVANWYMEYEKVNENVPDPVEIRDIAIRLNKSVAAYLAQA